MSANFADMLGICEHDYVPGSGKWFSISTASKGSGLDVVGQLREGRIFLTFAQGEVYSANPIVVRNISHSINVGVTFLTQWGQALTTPTNKFHCLGGYLGSFQTKTLSNQ